MKRMLALMCIALIACESSGAERSVAPARETPVPSSSPITRTETVELDFDKPGALGRVLFRLPYGKGKGKVGYLPPCLRQDCDPPCPCGTYLVPLSFAPTLDGGVWVLDPVKGRVARFSARGDLVKELAVPGNALRTFDVALVDERLVILGQRADFQAKLISLESGNADTRVLRFESEPAEAYALTSSQDRLFTTVFDEDENLDVAEIPVEVARDGTSAEVPGVPFLDGWKIFKDFAGPTTIALEVSSTHYNWSMEIDAVLQREIDGDKREVPGSLSWEVVVSEQGAIHLLIRAQTEKGGGVDAFWFLTVTPEGLVGQPVKLRGPTGRDDSQQRHLAMGGDGRPIAMWTGRTVLIFEALP